MGKSRKGSTKVEDDTEEKDPVGQVKHHHSKGKRPVGEGGPDQLNTDCRCRCRCRDCSCRGGNPTNASRNFQAPPVNTRIQENHNTDSNNAWYTSGGYQQYAAPHLTASEASQIPPVQPVQSTHHGQTQPTSTASQAQSGLTNPYNQHPYQESQYPGYYNSQGQYWPHNQPILPNQYNQPTPAQPASTSNIASQAQLSQLIQPNQSSQTSMYNQHQGQES
ncbi:hypothetical protein V8F33_012488 [Rhypophila sp. PSN 637]